MKLLDGYGRVSRVGGREGEGFGSPEEQEARIRAKIEALGATLGAYVYEGDVSGGKAVRDRQLEKLIRRCEAGESRGIVILEWARFSREHPFDAIETLNRLRKADAVLLSCNDGFDSSAPGAAIHAAGLAEGAYAYLQNAKARADESRQRAIARGVHASRLPFGYQREKGQPLEPNPETAPLVRELFELRADGWSTIDLTRWLESQGHRFAKSSVNGMLRNPTYLGQVRNGPYVTENAHPALVSRDLFDRVQAARGTRPVHTDTLASQCMLRSLLKCAACGSAMCPTNTQGKHLPDGTRERIAAYACNDRAHCKAGTYVKASDIDGFIDDFVMRSLEESDAVAEARKSEERLEQVTAELDEAERDFSKLKKSAAAMIAASSPEDFAEMVKHAKDRVEMLQIEHGRALNEAQAVSGFNGSMREEWPSLPIEDKRNILLGFVKEIRVTPAKRQKLPVAERVSVIGLADELLNHHEVESQTAALAA